MATTSSVFGESRTHIGPRHALIAPDGQIPSSLPGVDKATAVVLISREMGARFTQLLLTFQTDGTAAFPSNDTEAFAYVVRGSRARRSPGKYLFVRHRRLPVCPCRAGLEAERALPREPR